jgi:hypothetical protein
MKKLSKKEQKIIKGGKLLTNCYALCRPFLLDCPGMAKSDCPDFMACMNGCGG